MPAVGRGPLPPPNSVDATEFDRWYIASTGPTEPHKYYELIGPPGAQNWLLKPKHTITQPSDIVVDDDGSIHSMRDISAHLKTDYQALVKAGFS